MLKPMQMKPKESKCLYTVLRDTFISVVKKKVHASERA
jgi:hypothetical protein